MSSERTTPTPTCPGSHRTECQECGTTLFDPSGSDDAENLALQGTIAALVAALEPLDEINEIMSRLSVHLRLCPMCTTYGPGRPDLCRCVPTCHAIRNDYFAMEQRMKGIRAALKEATP